MMKKYKYRLSIGIVFAEKEDVKMLEKMATKGYRLVHLNNLGFYKLELGEPEFVSYCIDVNTVKPKSEEFSEYIGFFESGGWRYVCSVGDTFHYFSAPRGTTPIYTDNTTESLKYKNYLKQTLKGIGWGLLGSVVFWMLFKLSPRTPVFQLTLLPLASGLMGLTAALVVAAGMNLFRAWCTQRKKAS